MSTKIPRCIGCHADLRYIPYCVDGSKHPIKEMTMDEFKAKHVKALQKSWFEKLTGFLIINK